MLRKLNNKFQENLSRPRGWETLLYMTKHNFHKRHPWLRWDSNPRSQEASGHGDRKWHIFSRYMPSMGWTSTLSLHFTFPHQSTFGKWWKSCS